MEIPGGESELKFFRKVFLRGVLEGKVNKGAPTYFDGMVEALKPKILVIFVEEKYGVLFGLRAIPEALEKVERMS